jgi:hypothetical protein
MRQLLALGLILLATTPGFAAARPPAGTYACLDANGEPLGNLTLNSTDAYNFKGADGSTASGKMSSGELSVQALTGTLAKNHWSGTYSVEDKLVTFLFSTDKDSVTCGTPQN